MNNEFKEPDLSFSGETVSLGSLDIRTIHLLARKSPVIIFSLSAKQKRELLTYIKSITRESHTNELLVAMLIKNHKRTIHHIFKKQEMKLVDLAGEESLKKFIEDTHGHVISRESLLQKLHKMIFSEKSSFAQSGIFVSGVADTIDSHSKEFTLQALYKTKVRIVLACSADVQAYSFLGAIMNKVSGDVGRLLVREEVEKKVLDLEEGVVGAFVHSEDPIAQKREIMVGDATLKYPKVKIDATNAVRVALCPEEERQGNAVWLKAKKLKAYGIEKDVVQEVVVRGRSRIALKERTPLPNISQTNTLGPGQIGIFEIPIDITLHDADIQTVCVNSEGEPLHVIHFPATFLDKLRTYPDGENRVQVEIYNCGNTSVMYKDIYFRIRLYKKSGDKKLDSINRQKWRLRQDLQYGQERGFTALDYLVRRYALNVQRSDVILKNLSTRQSGLGDLRNIDNLFGEPHEEGILFSKKSNSDTCEVLSHHRSHHLRSRDVKLADVTGYQTDLVKLLQNACEIGREKRVIFVCRNDIKPEKLFAIIDKKKVTDIFSIPGKNAVALPSQEMVDLCKKKKIALTSIGITSEKSDPDIVFDLLAS